MSDSRKELKAWVRYDGSGKVVVGSMILRKTKPSGKFKELVNPATYECCNPTTTTTTTTGG
jgi:hypothetical protein